MPDLAAAIRERLDATTERNYPEMQAMGAALLAVLDTTTGGALPPNGCPCGGCLRLWVLHLVAEKLGIEAG